MEGVEFKETSCRSCGTRFSPIFARPNMRDRLDFFCKVCMDDKKHLEGI